jgi:RNA polymerase sigma-70 factor (ECF subfamily)
MSKENTVELDVSEVEDVEIEVSVEDGTEDNTESSEDQFQKADTSTQKRIDRLTKKMREAERRENEALSYAKKVKEEAEEVAQDTFIKAYESLSSFRGDSKFSSWLYSIAYRKALDALRKNKKNNIELIEEITEDDTSSIENALTYIEEKERKEVIQRCIKELPEQEAVIITFFYFEELSIKEISKITELSEDNVKVKLFRSRKKLFTLLKQFIIPTYTERNGQAI